MMKFIRNHPISVSLALLLHIVILVLFMVQPDEPRNVIKVAVEGDNKKNVRQIAMTEPMKTFTVDSAQVSAQLEKLQAQKDARIEAQKQLEAKTDKERQRLKELEKQQRAEKAKAERAKRNADEQKRKADAERKKTEEAKRQAALEKKKADAERKKAVAERKKAEQAKKAAKAAEKEQFEAKKKTALAEKQRKVEEQKKRELEKELVRKAEEKKVLEKAAVEAKRQKEKELAAAALQRQLEEEAVEQRQAQKQKQLLSLRETYISAITAKVKDNWRTPARISPDAQCDLKITQSPGGSITSVKVLNCNKEATKQFKSAAEKAVYRAEPLPPPPVKELFEREITFEFKP